MYLGMTVTLWGGWLRASAWTFDNEHRRSETIAVVRWLSDGQTDDPIHVMHEALARLDQELVRQADELLADPRLEVALGDGGGRDDTDRLPVSPTPLDIRSRVRRH